MTRLARRLLSLLSRDRDARALTRQIAEARQRHRPTRHLQAELTALRHRQLSGNQVTP